MSAPILWPWLGVLCMAACFSVHCLVLGDGFFAILGRWTGVRVEAPNAFLRVFLMSTAGLALNLMVLFALGLLGLLVLPAIVLLGVVPVLVWGVWRRRSDTGQLVRDLWPVRVRDVFTGVLVLGLFVLVLWPAGGAPGYWDDTMYHLPLARHYVQHGSLELAPYLRFPLFPQHMNLLLALGLVLGGDPLAQVFATLPLFFIALGLLGCGAWLMGSSFWGVVATLLLLAAPPVRQTWGYAYIDNGLALFCWAATVAMALSVSQVDDSRQRLQWAGLSAWLAAAAASTKLFGAVFAVLLGLQLWRSWRPGRAAWLYALVLLTAGGVWYVRSFLISGDPVHPAGGNWFGYFLWDAGDLDGQKAEQALHGVGREPWRVLEALAKAGVAWWGLAIVGLAGFFQASRPLRSFQLAFLAYLTFWFFVTQVERYLAPIFGVASLLSVLTVVAALKWLASFLPAWKGSAWRPSWSDALAIGLVGWGLWSVVPAANDRMRHRSEELASRTGHQLMVQANALIPGHGARLVHAGFENAVYFFEGTAIGDWFGPGRYRQMIDCANGPCRMVEPETMRSVMSTFDSRMLAVNTRRFPMDLPAYLAHFDLEAASPDGVLLVLKHPKKPENDPRSP